MSRMERVRATFARQETDRVGLYDLMLSDPCIEHFTGRYPPPGPEGAQLQAQAVDAMLDMARGVGVAPATPAVIEYADGIVAQEDGFLVRVDRYWLMGYERKPFDSYAGAVAWAKKALARKRKWREKADLKAAAQSTQEEFRKLRAWMGQDPTVCCLRGSGTGLDELRAPLGLEYFSYMTADCPGLISEMLELWTEQEVATIHAVADPKLSPFALPYGDIACKARLLHSPEWLRREFFPRLKRINDAYHQHGITCLFHSDGQLMDVMDDLIAAGIDGINPIETVAGMDVGEVYRRYGDRIFLTGGIDMSQLLSRGSTEQVRSVCRKAVADAPRGYFMGSTTEIDNSAKLENVLAMMEVALGERPQPRPAGRA